MNLNTQAQNINKYYFYIASFLLLIFIVLVPHNGHPFDTICWKNWSIYSATNGLQNIYFTDTDYLPLYHYVLFLFGKIAGSPENISQYIYYLKPITLLFHLVSGYFVLQLAKEKLQPKQALICTCIYFLLNFSIVYNALFWGQVDDTFTCFVFLSFYFAYKKRVTISLIALLIAINFKLQAIIFIPFIGLLLVPTMVASFQWRKLVIWIGSLVLIQTLILLPFITTNTVGKMWSVVTGSFGKYPAVSMFAFNFWDFFFWEDLKMVSDQSKILGITYKKWGLLFFFISSGCALFPLIRSVYFTLFTKKKQMESLDTLLLIGALIPLLFFFFNTQMHERYSHPALLFVMIYSIRNKQIALPILISIAYLLNLLLAEHFEKLSGDNWFIGTRKISAILYSICVIILYFRLYNQTRFKLSVS